MHDRSAWEKGSSGPQTIKGKVYHKLVEFTRPCVTCEKPFSIFVTAKIASGHADSNSFGLKNCEEHRRNKPASDVAVSKETLEELKDLQELQIEWSEVWKACYPLLAPYGLQTMSTFVAAVQSMARENAALKICLAKYELPAALQEISKKMPWD